MKTMLTCAVLCAAMANGACTAVAAEAPVAQRVSADEAYQIGVEAYHYFYPLISMEVTRRLSTNLPAGARPGMGPMNAFHHMRAYPDANFREVVRPNFDTLYSSAWLDLTREPMIISAPDTQGRYYLLPMLDMWSDVFAAPGSRTTGTGAGTFGVVPPGWAGTLPDGVERIDAPTPYVWIIGRTQTNGPADYDAVHSIQDGYTITPLSQWGGAPKVAESVIDPSVDVKTPPLVQVNTMPASRYFSLGAELMKNNPPHVTDWSLIARMQRIGIVPGKAFDFESAPAGVRQALETAAKDGLAVLQANASRLGRMSNGWQIRTDTMGVYGNAYAARAAVAMMGLGANQPEDAIYPVCVHDAEGKPLMGDQKYVIRFAKNEIPPSGAFWSITMYDADGFQVANEINRFAIGDRDKLQYNEDGSLEIYIQHEAPGKAQLSNWLPSPAKGVLGVTMRLYAPRPEALDGRWSPPAVRRVD